MAAIARQCLLEEESGVGEFAQTEEMYARVHTQVTCFRSRRLAPILSFASLGSAAAVALLLVRGGDTGERRNATHTQAMELFGEQPSRLQTLLTALGLTAHVVQDPTGTTAGHLGAGASSKALSMNALQILGLPPSALNARPPPSKEEQAAGTFGAPHAAEHMGPAIAPEHIYDTVPPSKDMDQCYFGYNGGHLERCFCQLAKNPGCLGQACSCPQGCDNAWDHHNLTVTFPNSEKAWNCGTKDTALLTIPRSYVKDAQFLKTWCPGQMEFLFREMLSAGFEHYVANVAPGPVHQCIHSAELVTLNWLHLHTFCPQGSVDRMPTKRIGVAWCAIMEKEEQAEKLAQEALLWFLAKYGALHPRPNNTCASMGCNQAAPGDTCSCNDKCTHYGDCCDDYQPVCNATAAVVNQTQPR